jgi:hypothetical protein
VRIMSSFKLVVNEANVNMVSKVRSGIPPRSSAALFNVIMALCRCGRCGQKGQKGQDGQDGQDGRNGRDGTDGTDRTFELLGSLGNSS